MAGSGSDHLRDADQSVLRVENMVVEFPIAGSSAKVHAVSDVSLDVLPGETLGVVGESGCGKSTTGKAIMRVPPPTSGRVLLDGVDLASVDADGLRKVRGRLQMIFQDPISSLNPRRTIRDVVAEPLVVRWLESVPRSPVSALGERLGKLLSRAAAHPYLRRYLFAAVWVFFVGFVLFVGASAAADADDFGRRDGGTLADIGQFVMGAAGVMVLPVVVLGLLGAIGRILLAVLAPIADIGRTVKLRRARKQFDADLDERVAAALDEVGIPAEVSMPKRPHEFSGGQAQRISIARALILEPQVIICDEPVSALDVSVQAQVLNLLEDLKASHGLSLIFIAHDLAVVKNISDRVQVMYLGKTCEVGHPDEIYARPRHPYTQALISAIPAPDPGVDPRESGRLGGELPSPIAPPSGCRFRTRCPRATEQCTAEAPQLTMIEQDHYVACHHPLTDIDWHATGAGGVEVTVGAGSTAGGGS